MLGILVQLIISAALLWFFEKQSLIVLGPVPVLVRFRQFVFGFIISALLCTITQLFNSSFTHSIWKLNAFGNPAAMIYIFIATGLMGYVGLFIFKN